MHRQVSEMKSVKTPEFRNSENVVDEKEQLGIFLKIQYCVWRNILKVFMGI